MLVVFNQYFLATGMTHKFRRIVALNGSNSARISTGIIHPQFVFEYISSFWQISEEELRRSILGGLIIANTFFPPASRKLINRFETCRTQVFKRYKLKVTISGNH